MCDDSATILVCLALVQLLRHPAGARTMEQAHRRVE